MKNFGVEDDTQLFKHIVSFVSPTLLLDPPLWTDAQLTLQDDIEGNVNKLITQQINKQQTTKEYKFHLTCQILGGYSLPNDPIILEEWRFSGCYLDTIEYGDLDKTSDKPLTIKLSIRFDNLSIS